MQVLGTFCVLINLNNLIDALRSLTWLLITFCSYIVSFAGKQPHFLQSDSNTMNPSGIRRFMNEPEETRTKNTEEKKRSVEILQGYENLQLANFAGCEISQHCSLVPAVDCFLTRLFMVLYKFSLHVILVH